MLFSRTWPTAQKHQFVISNTPDTRNGNKSEITLDRLLITVDSEPLSHLLPSKIHLLINPGNSTSSASPNGSSTALIRTTTTHPSSPTTNSTMLDAEKHSEKHKIVIEAVVPTVFVVSLLACILIFLGIRQRRKRRMEEEDEMFERMDVHPPGWRRKRWSARVSGGSARERIRRVRGRKSPFYSFSF